MPIPELIVTVASPIDDYVLLLIRRASTLEREAAALREAAELIRARPRVVETKRLEPTPAPPTYTAAMLLDVIGERRWRHDQLMSRLAMERRDYERRIVPLLTTENGVEFTRNGWIRAMGSENAQRPLDRGVVRG